MRELEAVGDLVELIAGARRTWVLTGAGMSTESGLPDYRGADGLWRSRRFEQLSSIEQLREDPGTFWEFYRLRLDGLAEAAPNAGHHALARLQQAGAIERVVTQNVDGLHQEAGNEDVLELHGSLRVGRCRSCGVEVAMQDVRDRWAASVDSIPWCACGEVLGPGVVLFGEALPLAIEHAFELAERSDLVLALGTSLAVFPAVAAVRLDASLGSVLPLVADALLGSD